MKYSLDARWGIVSKDCGHVLFCRRHHISKTTPLYGIPRAVPSQQIKNQGAIESYKVVKKYKVIEALLEKFSDNTNSFIVLSSSAQHPITEKDLEIARVLTEGLTGTHQICIKEDNSCGTELQIDIAFYEL